MIVIDATAAIAWAVHERPMSDEFEIFLLENDLIAPSLWRLEVLNFVLTKERQRVINVEEGARLLRDFDVMSVEIVDLLEERSLAEIANLARPHQLTAYDATYLDLALTQSSQLLTLDHNLVDAARRVGVALVAW